MLIITKFSNYVYYLTKTTKIMKPFTFATLFIIAVILTGLFLNAAIAVIIVFISIVAIIQGISNEQTK